MPDFSTPFWIELIAISKAIGAVATVSGILYGGVKWLVSIFKSVQETNNKIDLLTTNHIPHLQASLDEHTQTMQEIKSDVRDIGTRVEGHAERLEDTKKAVHTLGEAFLQHLQNTSKKETDSASQI
jgi:hypothetical protein